MYNILIESTYTITEYEEYLNASNETVYLMRLLQIGEFSVVFTLYIVLLITAMEYYGNSTSNLS